MELDGVTYTSGSWSWEQPRKGIQVTYCTDTRPLPVIAKDAETADLFICEGMYGETEKLAKAREHKHMTMHEAARLARDADTKEMWLTHYSPSLAWPEDYMNEVEKDLPAGDGGKGRSVR